jgi:hypothetical protein
MSAEHVVDDESSRLQSMSLGPRGAQAAVWRWCAKRSCRHPRYAIALSDRDSKTRVVPDLPTGRQLIVEQATATSFIVERGYGRLAWLVSTSGDITPLERTGRRGPAAPGEVVVGEGRGLAAVDPGTAQVHHVPTPKDLHEFWQTRGRLYGIVTSASGRSAFAVSVNGGKVWGYGSLPRRHALWMHVEGGGPAFIEGADGATLFPFVASWRFGSATFARSPGPTDPTAYVSCAHRLHDGRLLVCVDAWSDHSRKPGFWVSNDRTWSDFERIEPGKPFADDKAFQPVVVAERESPRGLTLVLSDPETGRVYATRDEGRHFEELAAR